MSNNLKLLPPEVELETKLVLKHINDSIYH